jgi:hypothetical protein
MERSRIFIVLVFVLISANVCRRWIRSFPVTASSVGQRSLSLHDYHLPETVQVKAQQPYTPMPPTDLTIAMSVATNEIYSRLANVDQDLPVREYAQIPYFWHIHKSGGKGYDICFATSTILAART